MIGRGGKGIVTAQFWWNDIDQSNCCQIGKLTLTNWLLAHPGVEIITRDRSKAVRERPSARGTDSYQVADRFHLLQNLAETLAQAFGAHQTLKTIASTAVISHCSR